MTGNKVYVEFIGLHGSGKSAIAQHLVEQLSRDGRGTLYYNKEARGLLDRYSKSLQLLYPMAIAPVRTYKIFRFCFKYRSLPYRLNDYVSGKPTARQKIKRLLREHLIFSQQNFDYFVSESLLHRILFYNPDVDEEFFKDVLNMLPDVPVYFVFVDTPSSLSLERAKERISATQKKRQPVRSPVEHEDMKEIYKQAHQTFHRFYEYTMNTKEYNGIKAIKLDGLKKPEENVTHIKETLAKPL